MTDIKYYGHSCFEFRIKGKIIITDPFIRPNPLANNIIFSELKADFILVSHGHMDHIADLIDLANQTQALVISTYEIHNWLLEHGYKNTHPMNIGGAVTFKNINFKMVQAVHTSSFANGDYAGSAAGFVVKTVNNAFYFAGDTALHYDMKLIPNFAKLDFAVLPIGDNFTMGIEDAVLASDFIECNQIIGMHYDTFEPIKINHQKALETFERKEKTLHLLPLNLSTTL